MVADDRKRDTQDMSVLEQTFRTFAMMDSDDESLIGDSAKYKKPLSLKTSLREKLQKNMMGIALFYCVCMIAAGSLLIFMNMPNAEAAYNPGGSGGSSVAANAILWSFISVLSLLFTVCLAYAFMKRRKKTDSMP